MNTNGLQNATALLGPNSTAAFFSQQKMRSTENGPFNHKDQEDKVSGPEREELVPGHYEESPCLLNKGQTHQSFLSVCYSPSSSVSHYITQAQGLSTLLRRLRCPSFYRPSLLSVTSSERLPHHLLQISIYLLSPILLHFSSLFFTSVSFQQKKDRDSIPNMRPRTRDITAGSEGAQRPPSQA